MTINHRKVTSTQSAAADLKKWRLKTILSLSRKQLTASRCCGRWPQGPTERASGYKSRFSRKPYGASRHINCKRKYGFMGFTTIMEKHTLTREQPWQNFPNFFCSDSNQINQLLLRFNSFKGLLCVHGLKITSASSREPLRFLGECSR